MKGTFLLGLVAFVAPLTAQQPAINTATSQVPQISIATHEEVRVTPDRATIQISVQTKAPTAAAAANENASKQAAVIKSLRTLGLEDDQISTINYNIYPEQQYEPNKEPIVVGYNVTNTLSVEVRKLSQIGSIIDATVSKGANMVTSLQFFASNTEEARRTAISSAVQKARLDAQAAARAASGTIGELLEIIIGPYSAPPPRPMMRVTTAMADQAQTPINPGEQTLSVDINTRWQFSSR
jgi:uncharacterized protein YggE